MERVRGIHEAAEEPGGGKRRAQVFWEQGAQQDPYIMGTRHGSHLPQAG